MLLATLISSSDHWASIRYNPGRCLGCHYQLAITGDRIAGAGAEICRQGRGLISPIELSRLAMTSCSCHSRSQRSKLARIAVLTTCVCLSIIERSPSINSV